ncbi:MAG: hypothetical protein ACKO2G_01245 [Verrucomicrobiales bacterium]
MNFDLSINRLYAENHRIAVHRNGTEILQVAVGQYPGLPFIPPVATLALSQSANEEKYTIVAWKEKATERVSFEFIVERAKLETFAATPTVLFFGSSSREEEKNCSADKGGAFLSDGKNPELI